MKVAQQTVVAPAAKHHDTPLARRQSHVAHRCGAAGGRSRGVLRLDRRPRHRGHRKEVQVVEVLLRPHPTKDEGLAGLVIAGMTTRWHVGSALRGCVRKRHRSARNRRRPSSHHLAEGYDRHECSQFSRSISAAGSAHRLWHDIYLLFMHLGRTPLNPRRSRGRCRTVSPWNEGMSSAARRRLDAPQDRPSPGPAHGIRYARPAPAERTLR
jgi:hypothetical protein